MIPMQNSGQWPRVPDQGGGGSTVYLGDRLVKGDWIAGEPSPLGERLSIQGGLVVFQQGTGLITLDVSRKYRVWTRAAWRSRVVYEARHNRVWTPALESDNSEG